MGIFGLWFCHGYLWNFTATAKTLLNPTPAISSSYKPRKKLLELYTFSSLSHSLKQMAKRLIPTLNRVLVEKIVTPSTTNSGILLPEKTPKLNSGKVVAVGPGAHDKDGKLIPITVKEGETVLLPEYGGTEVKLCDKEYHLYRDEDILGTLHD